MSRELVMMNTATLAPCVRLKWVYRSWRNCCRLHTSLQSTSISCFLRFSLETAVLQVLPANHGVVHFGEGVSLGENRAAGDCRPTPSRFGGARWRYSSTAQPLELAFCTVPDGSNARRFHEVHCVVAEVCAEAGEQRHRADDHGELHRRVHEVGVNGDDGDDAAQTLLLASVPDGVPHADDEHHRHAHRRGRGHKAPALASKFALVVVNLRKKF